ncbi:hypothetical protein RTP6_007614 [Batrachochytrium dendrobatidis]
MKLTILASILLACSVTTASPVNPSASASLSTESILLADLSSAAIFLEVSSEDDQSQIELSTLPVEDQDLVKDYLSKVINLPKAPESVKNQIAAQKEHIAELDKQYQQLIHKSQEKSHTSQYKDKVERAKLELKAQSLELFNLEKQDDVLKSEYDTALFDLNRIQRKAAQSLLQRYEYASSVRLCLRFGTKVYSLEIKRRLRNRVLRRPAASEERSADETPSPPQQEIQNSLPSYQDIMGDTEEYEVGLENFEVEPPSYDEVMLNPENFPKDLETHTTEPSLVETSITQPTQTFSSVSSTQISSSVSSSMQTDSPSMQTASPNMQTAPSSMQTASPSRRRVLPTIRVVYPSRQRNLPNLRITLPNFMKKSKSSLNQPRRDDSSD